MGLKSLKRPRPSGLEHSIESSSPGVARSPVGHQQPKEGEQAHDGLSVLEPKFLQSHLSWQILERNNFLVNTSSRRVPQDEDRTTGWT